jgi:hypothetical protein
MKQLKMGSYKVCQGCLGPIVGTQLVAKKKVNSYCSKKLIYHFHPACYPKWYKKYCKQLKASYLKSNGIKVEQHKKLNWIGILNLTFNPFHK